ncbi:hypothetical protein BR93DRAFT_932415 [Coniochaeta sp. PMI_546]|nr:hypothetical protein BR93DRAFT_932415 [Coniochaeta sp. PMI_546]
MNPAGNMLKPFQCSVCSRSFTKNEHLARHVRSHTKEKPFKCQNCGNRYGRQDILNRHRRDVRCRNPYADHATAGVSPPSPVEPYGPRQSTGDALAVLSTAASQQQVGRVASPDTEHSGVTAIPSQIDQNHSPGPASTAGPARPRQVTLDAGFLQTFNGSHRSDAGSSAPQGSIRAPQLGFATLDPFLSRPAQNPLSVPQIPQYSNCNEYSSTWMIDSGLHNDIMQINFPILEDFPTSGEIPSGAADQVPSPAHQIERIWFSRLPDDLPGVVPDTLDPGRPLEPISGEATGPSTPRLGNHQIEDRHRRNLQRRLEIFPYEPTVPSADLLNLWIRLYFAKAHLVFPIIHAATFRPSRSNTNLLIAMCAVGSLFTGSEQALRQGTKLFDRIHKATILNWDQLSARNPNTMVSIIQSALIAQMFGMLSGNPTLLLTVDAFHGPPIAWARHIRLHRSQPNIQIDSDIDGHRLDELWREWARNEELIRVAHGLYVIDAELANLLHREPFQNFTSYKFSFAASDAAFMAPNARSWKERHLVDVHQRQHYASSPDSRVLLPGPLSLEQVPATSSFTAYAILEGIGMQIFSLRSNFNASEVSVEAYQGVLTDFHQRFLRTQTQACHELLHLSILLNAVFMTVFVDIDLLERAMGREGSQLSPDELESLRAWASSENARSCVAHSLSIKTQIQKFNITSELAMHVPRALFWACLVLFCYIRFGSPPNQQQEMPLAGMDCNNNASSFGGRWDEENTLSSPSAHLVNDISMKASLFTMIDMLQHVGHWGLSRKFASILTTVCNSAFDYS